jgi:hypothetical protein
MTNPPDEGAAARGALSVFPGGKDFASPADRKLKAELGPYLRKTGWFGKARRKALREWDAEKAW